MPNGQRKSKTSSFMLRDKRIKTSNTEGSYYSRIFKQYVNLIRPVIKSHDKKFKKPDAQRFASALEKHAYLFLKFIKQPDLPFDNNRVGRELRMLKVKQKVSGCSRSQSHAQYFAKIRGYISTVKKNIQPVLKEIQRSLILNPFIPKLAE